ncbi:hypothetical protein EVG20_g5330 [Dentipellis fragilis]|uniref:Uncharacterized protein n=1 Tax=Dentipellis fragilis TaxID=205917 RepID=A0A4Y9YXA2_9AGAM|nr:hypothetical protein EVG20_g5330 [Dentipellis fragilis]
MDVSFAAIVHDIGRTSVARPQIFSARIIALITRAQLAGRARARSSCVAFTSSASFVATAEKTENEGQSGMSLLLLTVPTATNDVGFARDEAHNDGWSVHTYDTDAYTVPTCHAEGPSGASSSCRSTAAHSDIIYYRFPSHAYELLSAHIHHTHAHTSHLNSSLDIMPFFKKHDDNTTAKHTGTGTTTRRQDATVPQAQNVTNTGYSGNVSGAPVNQTPGTVDPSYAGGGSALRTGQGGQQYASHDNPQYGRESHDVPPTGHLNQGTGQNTHPGRSMEGKIEHAVGTLVGSKAFQARGAEKDEEAKAFKMQGQELAEAEQLEREAMMRRERAVGQGAHPDNRHLGGPGHHTTF